jgi:hypothetical protein
MIDSYFEYLASVMAAESTALGEFYSKHRGELGRNREYILRRILQQHMPSKFGFSSGFVLFSTDSKISTQQDIIIYDRINHPILFDNTPSPLFPLTAIQGLIEIKSNLTQAELESSIKKACDVKQNLRKSLTCFETETGAPILEPLNLLFAFESPPLTNIKTSFIEKTKDYELKDKIDIICVLNKGILISGNYFKISRFGQNGSAFQAQNQDNTDAIKKKFPHDLDCMELNQNAFLVFFGYMLSYLLKRKTPWFEMHPFLEREKNLGRVC